MLTEKLNAMQRLGFPAGFLLAFGMAFSSAPAPAAEPIDFNRQIRPLLSHCLKCHGGVKRESKLSLQFFKTATAPAKSGKPAIVPGKPDQSELIRRVTSQDPDLRMPPKGKPLDPEQIQSLRQWIASGGRYAPHWSTVGPENPGVPKVQARDWARNDIDRFVLARLEKKGLAPSPEANRRTLIRRLSLDLTGLPPTPQQTEAFVADTGADAYERLVDRLLASEAYGERWAQIWLDLARYADTQG